MTELKWKDHTDTNGNYRFSEARASREVRGRYRISFCPGGYELAFGGIAEPFYEVDFRHSGNRSWIDVGMCDTLVEAQRMAEEDHEERLREATTEATSS